MSDPIVTVQSENIIKATVQPYATTQASTNLANPTQVGALGDVGDVDLTTEGKIDGSLLVYKQVTNKWTSTKTLNNQTMDAGEF